MAKLLCAQCVELLQLATKDKVMDTVNRKVIPYDTGKVKIGLLYQPQSTYEVDYDASFVQGAMLNRKYKERKWYRASSATTAAMHLATAFLWAFALFVIIVKF